MAHQFLHSGVRIMLRRKSKASGFESPLQPINAFRNSRLGRRFSGSQVVQAWSKEIVLTFWFFNLLIGEWFAFHLAVGSCSWPWTVQGHQVHLAIFSDPQLTDKYSYSFTQNHPLLSKVVEYYSDVYMRKSFQLFQYYHGRATDAVIFLGDLFDSAKYLSDEEFLQELQRWNWIFGRTRELQAPFINVSGNHDVGYEIGSEKTSSLASRFSQYFGPLNQIFHSGAFQLVVLSSTAACKNLTNTSPQLIGETMLFLQQLSQTKGQNPRILFSHIPLWRPPSSHCGLLRRTSSSLHPDRTGFSYRTTLPAQATNEILSSISPIYVFSGDDHDQCTVQHENIPETTVGTFSWLQGNIQPSFALVTAISPFCSNSSLQPNSGCAPEVLVHICFLPRQIIWYVWYGLSGVASLLFLVLVAILRVKSRKSAVDADDLESAGNSSTGRRSLHILHRVLSDVCYILSLGFLLYCVLQVKFVIGV